jgi:4-amino-4-deoxy-L-arabinose transferase-like glycosyltransferase
MKTPNKFLYDHLFTMLLFLFILPYIAITYIYLRENTAPPRWDDSMYLEHSEIMFNAIHGHESYNPAYFNLTTLGRFNPASVYVHLLAGGHAPLISLLPLPGYFVFGSGFLGLAATFFALIVAFNLIFYRFVSEIADKPTALLAVVITSTMPLTIGLSRYFLVEYGLTILVTLWVYLQIKSNHFREGRYNVWMGIVLGLGMLMKVTFPIYIIGPILWGLASVLVETKFDKEKLINVFRNGLVVLLIGILLMSTWYLPNMKQVLTFAFNAGFGRASQDYSMGNPFDARVLLNYWVGVINIGTSAYYFFILAFLSLAQGIVFGLYKKRFTYQVIDRTKTSIWMMLSWFLVPFTILSFGVNKDIRFLLPALPPISFAIAKLMRHFFYTHNIGKVAIVLLIVFPCFMFIYTSLPFASSYSLHVGSFLMIAPQIGYATRPVNQTWPLEQMLLTINEDARKNKLANANSAILVGVIPNYEYFNPNNLGYFSAHNRLSLSIELFGPPLNDDWTTQKERILSKDYLVTKTGDQGPSFAYNPYLTPLLLDGELPFQEIARFKLPDGSDGIIYENNKLARINLH